MTLATLPRALPVRPFSVRRASLAGMTLAVRLSEWRQRIRKRRELRELSEANLQDIGWSRTHARVEAAKPFWRE
jgi:uncharacterized protein YjiS (DUF1127 family)